MSSDTTSSTYWQRRNFAYCLNPNMDWTKPEIQSAWRSYGQHVGRFLSIEQPLTREELSVLCRAYAVQHGNPDDDPIQTYDLDYVLLELFERSIVHVVEWWPLDY